MAGVRFVGAGLTLSEGVLLVGEVILGRVGAGLVLLVLGKSVQPLIAKLIINKLIPRIVFGVRTFFTSLINLRLPRQGLF
jgi:hypothetical protein